MLVGSLVIRFEDSHVETISMFVAIALIQPALYIVYWRLSGQILIFIILIKNFIAFKLMYCIPINVLTWIIIRHGVVF